jgi:hypothetical protein
MVVNGTRSSGGCTSPKIRFALDSPLEEAGFEPPVPPSAVSLQKRNCLLRKSAAPSFEPSRGWRFRTGRKLPYDAEVLDFSNRANFFVTAPGPR